MELNLEELKLIADFRLLDNEGQRELVAHTALLLGKQKERHGADPSTPANQCALAKQEERPENAKEPIFTE